MKQLFANNAKTTLVNTISATDIALPVADSSRFPSPNANEYFLVTLEINNQIEIVKVTSKIGNTLYLASVADRGQEGTSAVSFPSGSRVEVRLTKGTLDLYSKTLVPLTSVNQLVAPKDAYNTGYVCSTYDAYGNPALAVFKDDFTWRFINYTIVHSGNSTTSNTTTSLNITGSPLSGSPLGKYLVQITSGIYSGSVREVNSFTGTSLSWTSPLGGAPANGTSFEILQSNASILIEAKSLGDEAVIMALILGGNS